MLTLEMSNCLNCLVEVCTLRVLLFYFVLEIEDFLTNEECEHFIQVAKDTGLQESKTYSYRVENRKGILVRDINKDKKLSLDEVRW